MPRGKGLQLREYFDVRNDWACTNILLLAAGSGLVPIAAAIESSVSPKGYELPDTAPENSHFVHRGS